MIRRKSHKSWFLYTGTLFCSLMFYGCSYNNDGNSSPPYEQAPLVVAVPSQSPNIETDCMDKESVKTPNIQGRKTIEGTIVGHGGGNFWSTIVIESDGVRFSLETESWSPDGNHDVTLPGVRSGEEIPIGSRVRIVSPSLSIDPGKKTTFDLSAKRLVRLPDGQNADGPSIDPEFKAFFSELVSAVSNRDQTAI